MKDPSSLSNFVQIKTSHIHLNLKVDFNSKTLSGYAQLKALCSENGVAHLSLDTSNLDIKAAKLISSDGKTTDLKVFTV